LVLLFRDARRLHIHEATDITKAYKRLHSIHNSGVGSLGLVVIVVEQRVGGGSPRVDIGHTPGGDGNARRGCKACLDDGGIVVGRGICNIQLSDGDVSTGTSKGGKGGLSTTSTTSLTEC